MVKLCCRALNLRIMLDRIQDSINEKKKEGWLHKSLITTRNLSLLVSLHSSTGAKVISLFWRYVLDSVLKKKLDRRKKKKYKNRCWIFFTMLLLTFNFTDNGGGVFQFLGCILKRYMCSGKQKTRLFSVYCSPCCYFP